MTIKDIANIAGVSISTVSKIVNNKDQGINENTRNHVLKIVKEYNYTPYSNIKSNPNSKTFIIGVMLKESSKPNLFLNGILSIAQEKGYSILIYTNSLKHDTELKNINSLIKNNVDGVIWEPIDENSLIHESKFKEKNINIVYINASFINTSCYPNFFQMGYIAGEKLINLGHKNIACIVRPESFRSDTFLLGFKKSLFDNNIDYKDEMCLQIDSPLLRGKILSHEITAVITAHEQLGIDIIDFINKINYKIPKDISIITLWEDAIKRSPSPNYAGIKVPYYEFGVFVCKKIIKTCENVNLSDKIFSYNYLVENEKHLSKPFSNSKKRIIVVGSLNVDTTLSVNELPLLGNTVMTDKVLISPGGKGANEAVAVSRMGYPVSIIGKLGDDYDSSIVYTCLHDNNIDITALSRDENAQTGRAYIHRRNDGESLITVLAGANNSLSEEDILKFEYLFKNSSFCLMQTEVPTEALIASAKTAHKYNVKTVLKPATLTNLDPDFIKYIDIFVPNLSESKTLCKKNLTVPKMAEYFCSLGPSISIITLAEKGVYIHSRDFKGYIPATSFTPIDTTGGADAFIAAFIIYLYENYPIEKAARIANYASGFCISRQGTTPAMINRAELENYIKRMEIGLID